MTNIQEMLDSFNNVTPTVTFTLQEEIINSVNFLDVTISKYEHKVSCNVYRQPTATDIIILNDSCRPPEQKLAAVRYLVNRLSTYPINETNKRQEYYTIKQILNNNEYDVKILNRINGKTDTKTRIEAKKKAKTKWAKFTYIGRQPKFITKLFKNSDLKVSFKADNTVGKLLTHNKNTSFNKYNTNTTSMPRL
jgi:hypothetical protein